MLRRKWLIAVAVLTVLAALAIPVAALAVPVAQTAQSVSVEMTASPLENGTATYEIFVTNDSSEPIEGLAINVPLPAGTQLQSSYAGEPGQLPAQVMGTGLQWMHGGLAAGEMTGPYVFMVSTSEETVPAVSAVVTWTGPVPGSAVSTAVAPEVEEVAEAPRRGCFACHAPGSRFNLVVEAESRAQAAGLTHPPLDPNVTASDCLTCHGAGTGARAGLGTAAQLSLRDILHPSHMFSEIFVPEFRGNCFSCHNVDSQGTFVLLNDQLAVNEKGLPLNPPIMGIPPSQGSATAGQTTTGLGGAQ